MKGLLFTYALTYGGALASLFNPFYGLLVYFCFAIIKPSSMWYWSVPPGNRSRIVAVALVVGWALRGFGDWRLGKGKVVVFLLLSFLIWCVASTIFAAEYPEIGWNYCESLAKTVLPFVVGLTLINSLERLRAVVWVLVLSQAYVAFEMNMAYFNGFNRLHMLGHAGLDNNSCAIAFVTAIGLCIFLFFNTKTYIGKAASAGSLLVMMHAIMFSFSRGGLLTLILTAGVAFVLLPKKPSYYLIFALAVAIGIRLAGPQVIDRFVTVFADQEERDESSQSRLDLWADCWDLMKRKPIFGGGPDHWGFYARDFYEWGTKKEAHSTWLQTGAETGFLGLFLLAGFYLYTMFRLWPFVRDRHAVWSPEYRDFARMVICALFAFGFSSQFVTLEGLELSYYVAMLGAAILKLHDLGVLPADAQPAQPNDSYLPASEHPLPPLSPLSPLPPLPPVPADQARLTESHS